MLPKKLLQQYHLAVEVDLQPTPEELLINPVVKPRRQGWDERFQQAIAKGQAPEGELLEGFSDDAFVGNRMAVVTVQSFEVWIINLEVV